MLSKKFETEQHICDLCVVGGGLAGMCTAIAAARRGLSVVLMQDRPLFGGNTSSEIRMWVSGARGLNNRETGIIEEIALENLYRNPERSFPIWDTVLFDFIVSEKNITPILNCSCLDAEMNGNKIVSITGWQTTTQKFHTVSATYFADCSGDSILAPLTNAEFRLGREGGDEFGESIAPPVADKKTMGLTCLIQGRETERPIKFTPPTWAYKYTKEDLLPHRLPEMHNPKENYWYMEIGGENDSIKDTEKLRDELLKIALGIWDFVKNSGEYETKNWSLDFLGFLPGKRESRRYVGDYIMTQNDVRAEGKFEDTVAFGGWPMDDHNPAGINTKEAPTIFHPAPSPFGIPYRSLYSKNIENLWFAGRNISVTHCAMSSTRVMATCALIGQAVGTAAAIAKEYNTTPRGVYENHITLLKEALMNDDCYLPGNASKISDLTKSATVTTSARFAEKLFNGHNRPIGDEENAWVGKCGDFIMMSFAGETYVDEIAITFDSDLNRETIGAGGYVTNSSTLCNRTVNMPFVHLPETLVKDMKIEYLDENGLWQNTDGISENKRRLVKFKLQKKVLAIKLTPVSTYGKETVRIFGINLK
ncbi:MAG: FAD-dependent oxidoreductase [Clostridia bacterium]|nr:FAD-dependent oxidoreductase [Clostridia bacterium]